MKPNRDAWGYMVYAAARNKRPQPGRRPPGSGAAVFVLVLFWILGMVVWRLLHTL